MAFWVERWGPRAGPAASPAAAGAPAAGAGAGSAGRGGGEVVGRAVLAADADLAEGDGPIAAVDGQDGVRLRRRAQDVRHSA